ncbi:unnamed protein product [Chironomus riparius]|uniref:Arrestin C-terminal-like domain-containing protein n=1 Tax=Chironomus riparius TaxID=315576 RepID=A0A9N9RZ23_9DIPT|nr:unnamed protein product [Chironomus riparius]
MGKSNTISITLDNTSAVYYPCQVVSGAVDLKVFETIKKARGLRLTVEGKSVSEWTESVGKTTRTFQGEQKHLDVVTYLFGEIDGDSAEVPAGIHTYKFSCRLPPNLPYSVDGEHGHIRYKVDACLDIPWTICDLHAKLPFTVARREDLNLFPELRMAQEVEEIKKFCWGICDKNPLQIKIRLPKSGFALGENVHITIEYNNMSSHCVDRTEIALWRKEKFVCSDPVKKDRVNKTKITETTADGVSKNSEAKIYHVLQIPQILTITNRLYTQVFQISYELKINVLTDGCSPSPSLKMPITIGNIPIRDVPSISINQ